MIKFTKMQGLGNDFIVTEFENAKQYNLKIFSKFVCDRHFGIGADGLILFSNSKFADFKMRIFNNDGTEAEMCGNGIRCLAKYLYEKELTNKEGKSLLIDESIVNKIYRDFIKNDYIDENDNITYKLSIELDELIAKYYDELKNAKKKLIWTTT